MRYGKRSLTILNVIFICLLLSLQSVAGVFGWRDYKTNNMNAAKRVEADFRDLFWKIETVNSLSRQYEFINTFAYLSEEEVGSLSFIDRIKGTDAIRSFNSVIDASCECALYFAESGCVLSSDGMIALEEYASFFSGEGLSAKGISEIVSLLPEFRIIPEIQFIYHNNWSEASVFVRKNYTVRNVALLCVVKNSYFDKLRQNAVGENGTIGVAYENRLFYGQEKGEHIEVPYFNVDIFANEKFNVVSFAAMLLVILFLVCGLYVLMRLFFIKTLCSIDGKLRAFNEEFECGLQPERSVTENLEHMFLVVKEREADSRSPLMRSKDALVQICFKLLLFTEYGEEALRFLRKMGVRDDAPRRIVVEKSPSGIDGYRIDNRFLCVEGDGELVCGVVCGIGTIKRSLKELKSSCEEAKTAYNYAVLYNETDVFYDRMPKFSSLDIETDKVLAKLKSEIVSNERDACGELIEDVFARLEKEPFKPSEILDLFERIAAMLTGLSGAGTLLPPNYQEKSISQFKKEVNEYALELIEQNRDKPTVASARFEAIKEYIDSNFTNPDLSLKYLASKFNYSVSYISKMFLENTFYNYSKYINRKRVELAKKLIKKNKKIVDIANICGFKQVKTFRTIFKEYVGVTPMEFKSISYFEKPDAL